MLKKTVEIVGLGKSRSVEVSEDETIGDALNKAGITADMVLADGEDASFNDAIGKTEVITVVPKVKGGQ